jgi:hypothetical protein
MSRDMATGYLKTTASSHKPHDTPKYQNNIDTLARMDATIVIAISR